MIRTCGPHLRRMAFYPAELRCIATACSSPFAIRKMIAVAHDRPSERYARTDRPYRYHSGWAHNPISTGMRPLAGVGGIFIAPHAAFRSCCPCCLRTVHGCADAKPTMLAVDRGVLDASCGALDRCSCDLAAAWTIAIDQIAVRSLSPILWLTRSAWIVRRWSDRRRHIGVH
jgi:hypothetical protein